MNERERNYRDCVTMEAGQRCLGAGFEDGGGGHEIRNASGLCKLEKVKKWECSLLAS